MNVQSALRGLALAAAATGGAYLAWDAAKTLSIKAIPDLPKEDKNPNLIHELLLYLENDGLRREAGVTIDDAYIQAAILPAKTIIDGRYDCMDFRMQTLLRLQYRHGSALCAISPKGAKMIEDAFLNAKYWMTEPGEDSMCYWSENHQLLFAVAEYLAGQWWKDRIFSNAGVTGAEHMRRGRERIGHWMRQRFRYGYSEFNSSNYYLYSLGPAMNFIEFAAPEDAQMVTRMKMCADLLLFDVAAHMRGDTFLAPTGRAYVDNMAGETGDRLRQLTDYLWGRNENWRGNNHSQMMHVIRAVEGGYYDVPPVLLAIGEDTGTKIIKSSHSLDTAELERLGYVGHGDFEIMRQMCMEAFTNPEVIHNTVTYLEQNGMLSNKFVNYFKVCGLKGVRGPKVLRMVSERLKPMPNGIAIQRANLYCYRTANCALSCVQRYHPGGFGAQQMLQCANFGGKAVAFTAHPAKREDEKSVRGYPGYWAGFGRAPHAVQHENIQILLFRIPKKRGFLELYDVPQFTHTYLPEAYFDEVVQADDRHVYARAGEAFLALITSHPMRYKAFSMDSAKAFKNGLVDFPNTRFDLIQEGDEQFWIYELSDASKESFADFQARVRANAIEYGGNAITYESNGRRLITQFGGTLMVNGELVDLQHKRFDSDYCVAERDAAEYTIAFGGHSLRMNFEAGEREVL